MWELLGLFVMGALYDAGFVLWVHFADRHRALPAGLMAMALYWTSMLNTVLVVRDWHTAIAFGLGMGCGSFTAVRWKARQHRISPTAPSS